MGKNRLVCTHFLDINIIGLNLSAENLLAVMFSMCYVFLFSDVIWVSFSFIYIYVHFV